MKGVLMGIWIVSQKWLEDSCEKGYLVEENSYEATGSTKLPEANGPKKGRLNASCQVRAFDSLLKLQILLFVVYES